MTLFEYLAVAYSLVISFSVVRAASVLPHVLAPERRYWVHTVWVLAILAVSLLVFWNFWSFREVEWTLGQFSLSLALPTSVFIAASIVAPDEPAEIQSWHEYFYFVHATLFASGILFSVIAFLTSTVILEMPLLHPLRVFQLAVFGICVTGAFSGRSRVHAGLAILVLLSFAFSIFRMFTEPGSLTSSQ